MSLLRTLSLACILIAASSITTQARTRHTDTPTFDRHGGSEIGSRIFIREIAPRHVAGLKQIRKKRQKRTAQRVAVSTKGEAQLLPHPSGCPSRAFCGCGASIEVFGKSIRELWLASNWFKFPRTSPAPGMVAVRRHHVFVIREVKGPGLVLAYDANSGGHRTRLHLRRLSGYTIVNPRGARYADAN